MIFEYPVSSPPYNQDRDDDSQQCILSAHTIAAEVMILSDVQSARRLFLITLLVRSSRLRRSFALDIMHIDVVL